MVDLSDCYTDADVAEAYAAEKREFKEKLVTGAVAAAVSLGGGAWLIQNDTDSLPPKKPEASANQQLPVKVTIPDTLVSKKAEITKRAGNFCETARPYGSTKTTFADGVVAECAVPKTR